MKTIGIGTFTEVNGEQVENGMVVDDDFPEVEVDGASLDPESLEGKIVHSFQQGEAVIITGTFHYGPADENEGFVHDVFADANNTVLVTVSTKSGLSRNIPSPFVDRAPAATP